MTYTDIIASLDNSRYVGKHEQPIKKLQYRARITIATTVNTYTRTVYHKTHLGLMRCEQEAIQQVLRIEIARAMRFIEDEPELPELLEVEIEETDLWGNVRMV